MVTDPADEQLHDEAVDLAETLHYWSEREVAAFGVGAASKQRGNNSTRVATTNDSVRAKTRQKANQVMRTLLFWHEAEEELPTALTVLDALEQVAPKACKVLAANSLGHPAILAALARLVLKCSGTGSPREDELRDDTLAEELAHMGEELVRPEVISHMEMLVVSALDGRVGLSSPLHWAGTVVARLKAIVALRAGEDAPAQIPEGTVTSVRSWAWLLTEKITATGCLPPRALGLTACGLGLIATGVLPPEEIWPQDVTHAEWQSSLLAQVRHDLNGGTFMEPLLRAEELAQAACCSKEELCDMIFDGVTALQTSLSG